MPRLKIRPPKLSKDKNYAVVYCNGERLPMGRWGSAEADKNYRRFLSEWAACNQSASNRPGRRANVEDVAAAFLDFAEINIDHRDYTHTKLVAQVICTLYAGTPVDEFGPKSLAAVQKNLEQSGEILMGTYLSRRDFVMESQAALPGRTERHALKQKMPGKHRANRLLGGDSHRGLESFDHRIIVVDRAFEHRRQKRVLPLLGQVSPRFPEASVSYFERFNQALDFVFSQLHRKISY